MNLLADDSAPQVFILRMWREPRAVPGAAPEWRGVVEHLPSGNRRYVKNLDEIAFVIIPYLREMGLVPGLSLRLKYWWWQWKHRMRGRT